MPAIVSMSCRPKKGWTFTASFADLLKGLLQWSPSVLAQVFFSGDLVDCGIDLVASNLATGVVEGAEDDGESGAVASDGGSGTDCLELSCCAGKSIGMALHTSEAEH